MSRKLWVGVIGAGLVAAGVWWLFLRSDGKASRPAANRRAALAAKSPAAPDHEDHAPAQRGAAPRWSIDPDVDGRLRLEGQVLGPDGSGAAGAEVWISSVPPRSAKTEEDGSFSFDKLVGRTYSLTATSGTRIGGPIRTKLTATSDPVVIRLAEAAAVRVTVVDDAARPIQDAEVKLDELAARAVKTDNKGTATLAPVRPGWVEVLASASGYAPASGLVTIGEAGSTASLTITLHQGYPVSGRVIDEAGKPIANARVAPSDGAFGSAPDSAAATTDAKGAFTLAALASGSHTLSAVDGEHAPAWSGPITVSGKPVDHVEIVMKAGGVIAGTVVDPDARPVAYATVRVTGNGEQLWRSESRQATTNDKGQFELRGLARAKLLARAESDTAASGITDVDLSAKLRVDDLKLVLDVTGTIAGIVVDEKGEPVPEVQVHAFPDFLGGAASRGGVLAGLASTTSGGGGEFVVRGLPDGAYRVSAARQASRFNPWGQQGTPARTGDKQVRITLPSPGALIGKVVLSGSGAAPKLVHVSLEFLASTPATDGVFELLNVSPGSYDVTFRGLEFAEHVQRDVKIEPGKTTDLGTITVTRGRRLTGKVVDKAGSPVAGAKVKLGAMLLSMADEGARGDAVESMTGIRSVTSDQDGAFTLVGLSPKPTNVLAEHPQRGRSAAIAVPGGDADPPPITLELRGFGSIAGKVTQQGKPVPNVMVSESGKGGGAQSQLTRTSGDGAFVLAKVPEGTHVLSAMQAGLMSMKSTSVTVQVTAGKQTTANIEIPVGTITASVQVKPRAGHRVDAAQIFLFAGAVEMTNGQQLSEAMFQGSVQGMKFWFGGGKPAPEFPELIAGAYSICALPITGDMNDPKFQRRLQENTPQLKVYCKAAQVTPSPLAQSFEIELPAMVPFPDPSK